MIRIYTIGHSTRPIDDFFAILKAYGIQSLVDVRRYPGSKRNPQYNLSALEQSLPGAGIAYSHIEGLGGRRSTSPESINTAWREASFRGYADYMQTPAFAASLEQLIAIAQSATTAFMCSEAVPWRCHRSLIADALIARGFEVIDILSETDSRPHRLTPFAVVEGDKVTYPGNGGGSLF